MSHLKDEPQVIDSWIFEYMTYRCIKSYFEDGCDSEQLRQDIVVGLLTAYLNDDTKKVGRKEYVCHLFLHLLCMEESLAKEEEIGCAYIATEDFSNSVTHCIAFATRDSKIPTSKKLASCCLIQTHVVLCKYYLQLNKKAELAKALKGFEHFVDLMPGKECKEKFELCSTMTSVAKDDDFIGEFMERLRHLILSLYSEFDEPFLLQTAKSTLENDTANHKENIDHQRDIEAAEAPNSKDTEKEHAKTAIKDLVQDRRPSRLSHLVQIAKEESRSFVKLKKKFAEFNKEEHLHKIRMISKRIKKRPISHQTFRCGPWLPEEEREFIKATLKFGAGRWVKIKNGLKSTRSSQQLKDKWRTLKDWQIEEVKKESL